MNNFFIGVVAPLSILIPICMFLYTRKHADRSTTIIFYYLIAAGLINVTAVLLAKNGIRNLPLLHLYTVVETIFFLSYFRTIFDSPRIKKVLIFVMIAFTLCCMINLTFIQSIFTFNTHTRPLEALIVTGTCLLYFFKSGFSENWLGLPINWINMGVLIYFPAASIIFILSNYFTFVKLDDEMSSVVWNMHAGMVIGMYLMFAKAFSLLKKSDGNT